MPTPAPAATAAHRPTGRAAPKKQRKLPHPSLPATDSPDFWRCVFLQSLAQRQAVRALRARVGYSDSATSAVISDGEEAARVSRKQSFNYWMQDVGGLAGAGRAA